MFDCQRVREKVESAQSSSPRRRIFQRSTEPARPLDQSARELKNAGVRNGDMWQLRPGAGDDVALVKALLTSDSEEERKYEAIIK